MLAMSFALSLNLTGCIRLRALVIEVALHAKDIVALRLGVRKGVDAGQCVFHLGAGRFGGGFPQVYNKREDAV